MTGKYVNSSGKGKIGGESIADDAVIFVKDSAGKFSTMAGSDFAKYSTTSVVDQNITAYANKDNSTGYNSIVLAYVELNAKVNSITSNYGYVTSAVSTTKNNDGETVSSFTFWDGATEHKDIMTDEKVSCPRATSSPTRRTRTAATLSPRSTTCCVPPSLPTTRRTAISASPTLL